MNPSYMSEEKNKDDETVKKVGTISYCAYEEAATYDWTKVRNYGLLPLHRGSSSVKPAISQCQQQGALLRFLPCFCQMLIDQESNKKNQSVGPAFYAMKAVHAGYDKWGKFISDGLILALLLSSSLIPQLLPLSEFM